MLTRLILGFTTYSTNDTITDDGRKKKETRFKDNDKVSQHPCPNLHCTKVFTSTTYLQKHRIKCKAPELGESINWCFTVNIYFQSPDYLWKWPTNNAYHIRNFPSLFPRYVLRNSLYVPSSYRHESASFHCLKMCKLDDDGDNKRNKG